MTEALRHAEVLWDYVRMHHEVHPADAILALGSNATSVAARAADLFLDGYAPLLVCVGGNGAGSHLLRPEAEVYAEIARRRGVPAERILCEIKSSNTGENIAFTKDLLAARGYALQSVILVHKPFMERRAYATCSKVWPEVACMVTSPARTLAEHCAQPQGIELLVGTVERIREYGVRGFQIGQEIPAEVEKSYAALRALGYGDYETAPEAL